MVLEVIRLVFSFLLLKKHDYSFLKMKTTAPNNTFSLDKSKIPLKENLVPETPSITVSKEGSYPLWMIEC